MQKEPVKTNSNLFQQTSNEDVSQTLDHFAQAISSGDIDKIMEFYSDDVVAYDMMPPLEFRGKEKYKDTWETCFTNFFRFPVRFDYENQKIDISGDLALTHSLVHMIGDSKDGEHMETWMRNTTHLRKLKGQWLITHEHNSVPLDEATMKGLMDLKPETPLH